MMKRRAGLVAIVLFSACKGLGSFSPIDAAPGTGAYPENRGITLPGPPTSISLNLAWEDAAEIVYIDFASVGGESSIRAVRVADGVGRVLNGPRPAAAPYRALVVSPDGKAVFFTAGGMPSLHHAIPGASAVQLSAETRFLGNSKYSAFGAPVLSTRDSKQAAYVLAPDSVRLYDIASRTSRPLARFCTGLIAFSPDGQQILCRNGGDYFMMSVADGSLKSYAPPRPDLNGSVKTIRWGDAGLQFTYSGAFFVTELVDLGSGSTTQLTNATHLATFEFTDLGNLTWSRDGRKLAYSTGTCADFSCRNVQHILYVLNVATMQRSRVAVLNLPGGGGNASGIGAMAFSPDASRIAYIGGGLSSATVYVATVP